MRFFSSGLRQSVVFGALLLAPVFAQAQDEEPASDYDPVAPTESSYNTNNSGNAATGDNAVAAEGTNMSAAGGASVDSYSGGSWWQWWMCYMGYCDHPQHHNPGNSVPLDGGLSLLLVAGAGYGVKRYNDSRKHKKDETIS